MKKTIASIIVAAFISGCGGGGSDTSNAWHPIWVYDSCIGVTGCAYKTFDTEYATEAACYASPEVQNTVGMPINVRSTCYYSEGG